MGHWSNGRALACRARWYRFESGMSRRGCLVIETSKARTQRGEKLALYEMLTTCTQAFGVLMDRTHLFFLGGKQCRITKYLPT